MSGGVDSSVTAALLQEQGYEVIGLFMKNWEEEGDGGECTSEQDFADVVAVCEKLGIPYYSVEFVKEYRDHVFAYFLKQYEKGFTPNPDILCNREIKFDIFLKRAMDLGADYLATGHYARVLQNQAGDFQLGRGKDTGKDQSYFLHAIGPGILDKVLFPVGEIEKSEVRALAGRFGLSTQKKKDSTGVCFIGERDFRKFLSQYIPAQPGDFALLDGTVVGEHIGSAFYTLGQRKGLGLGGAGEPWFVVAKDPQNNRVYVERGEQHPALFTNTLWAGEETWIQGQAPESIDSQEGWACTAKVRYRQKDQACRVFRDASSSDAPLKVLFEEDQRAVTPGQSVVFYSGDVCLGGAEIARTGPTRFEQAGHPWPLDHVGV